MIEVKSRSNKTLKPIKFSYMEGVKDRDADDFSSSFGKLPFVNIGGTTIESKDIIYFRLYNDKFLPELEMSFRDPTNKMFDNTFPLDKQIVSILISSLAIR